MIIEAVFQYRTLVGKCDLGVGLGLEEIEQIVQIEAQFAPTAEDLKKRNGRKFRREAVRMNAVMRGDRIHDRVEILEIGPGGLVARNAPYIARGERIELVFEIGDYSYRFRAQGVWLKDDGDDYRVGLAFVGMPVRLNKLALSSHQPDVIDRIAAAA